MPCWSYSAVYPVTKQCSFFSQSNYRAVQFALVWLQSSTAVLGLFTEQYNWPRCSNRALQVASVQLASGTVCLGAGIERYSLPQFSYREVQFPSVLLQSRTVCLSAVLVPL